MILSTESLTKTINTTIKETRHSFILFLLINNGDLEIIRALLYNKSIISTLLLYIFIK